MTDGPSDTVALADSIAALCYAVVGWITIVVGLLIGGGAVRAVTEAGLSAGSVLFTLLALVAAFVFVALGAFVNPGMRRRLNRRHAPSTFGRVRSVDRRVVRSVEDCTEHCVSCQSSIEQGLIRRYREEFAIAGLPLYTYSEGHNHYCLDCATTEVLDESVASDIEDDTAARPRRRSADERRLERR